MNALLAPRALARAAVLLALALLAATPAAAQLRNYQVRWVPQGTVAADGYDLHLRLEGSSTWSILDLGFVPTNSAGLATYTILLNDAVSYDLAISAYVLGAGVASELSVSTPMPAGTSVAAREEVTVAVLTPA